MKRDPYVEELDRRRLELGLGANTWGQIAEVSYNQIVAILRGQRVHPSAPTLSRLAAALGAVIVLKDGEAHAYDADDVKIEGEPL